MVGQSFDGAATMAGIKSGVAKRFIERVPYAVFVHCYAHKLNLALQDATNQLKCVSDVLLIVNNVSVFIERSAKRHALFEHLQSEEKKRTLKSFCATRWSSRYLALRAFVKLYKYLLTFLEIVDDDNDKAIGAAARGFQKQVKSFNFVFYCNILLLLFEKTHILSKFLQKPNANIVQALDLCDITIMNLEQMKENCFDEIISECKIICEDANIEIPTFGSVNECYQEKQRSKKRKNIDNDDLNDAIINQKEQLIKIIDIYKIEIRKRFPREELNSIILFHNLLMLKDNHEHSQFDYNLLLKYSKFIDFEKIRHEVTSFISYKKKFNEVDWKDLSEVIKHFVEKDLKSINEEAFKVLKIYLTIPICSAEAVRAISVLKLLKTCHRT
jgi:hypothetical protein